MDKKIYKIKQVKNTMDTKDLFIESGESEDETPPMSSDSESFDELKLE